MIIFETIIFSFLSFITVTALIIWLWKRKNYVNGQSYDTRKVIALYTIPRIVIIWFVILLIFFVLELNKLHLLYIFLIIYFITNVVQTKRVFREDNKRK